MILAARLTGIVLVDQMPLDCTVRLEAPGLTVRTARTNLRGEYVFYAVRPGEYKLTLTYRHYKPVEHAIYITPGTTVRAPEVMAFDDDLSRCFSCDDLPPVPPLEAAMDYPYINTLGTEVTEHLEEWCLERDLDPLEIIAVADQARATLAARGSEFRSCFK